jgi:hypothetical protein
VCNRSEAQEKEKEALGQCKEVGKGFGLCPEAIIIVIEPPFAKHCKQDIFHARKHLRFALSIVSSRNYII